MKTPRIVNAIGHIDDDLINSATKSKKVAKKNIWIKWTSLVASFAIIIIVAAVAVPTLFGDGNTTLPVVSGDNTTINNSESATPTTNDNGATTAPVVNQDATHINNAEPTTSGGNDNTTTATNNDSTTQPAIGNESAFSETYVYNVSDGKFSTYVSGKVISEDKIDYKIADVSVAAGWKNSFDEQLTTETLRAEVYLIKGISKDVAVALKFIDKGDALTTTHYYVIMNPDADLTSVKEYLIAPLEPNNNGDEVAGEIGVPLKEGYNGDLTSRQNGSVGGYMVKKMIEAQERQMAGK